MTDAKLIEYLSGFVTQSRLDNFAKILNLRTKYITVVLEDIYQSHNASAVLRSCDCFGIQDVHVIENKNKYSINPDVALGATKWLNLVKYNSYKDNTLDAIKKLKNQNYRIVATTPHNNDVKLNDLDIYTGQIALFFGSEMPGVSNTIIENADELLYIPMCGFTESFNISVSVAICLYDLTQRLRLSNLNWKLNNSEKQEILLSWLKQSIKNSDQIIERYLSENTTLK